MLTAAHTTQYSFPNEPGEDDALSDDTLDELDDTLEDDDPETDDRTDDEDAEDIDYDLHDDIDLI